MIELHTADNIKKWNKLMDELDLRVGFVPTMGALHEGHISLVDYARKHCDVVVSSIFVNPTQFNDAGDFEKYPITMDADRAMLTAAGCDLLFYPGIDEIYPDGREYNLDVDLGYLAECMEATNRPGHFEGVMQVVKRLLEITEPDVLYLGAKDYQQFKVVSRMVETYEMPVSVVACPIIRETEGLAMSSRNRRLSEEERHAGLLLSQSLRDICDHWEEEKPSELIARNVKRLESNPLIRLEYLEIADADTMRPIRRWEDSTSARAFVAAFAGQIRLIDNMRIY